MRSSEYQRKVLLMRALILMMGVLSFSTQFAMAKSEFSQKASCGSAKVVSGDTCSNVKIEMAFDGCPQKASQTIAPKIICKDDVVKARIQSGNNRWEAEFQKQADGWGVSWKSLGPIKFFERIQETAAAEKKSTDRTPAGGATPVAIPPAQPEGTSASSGSAASLKFSGFFDIRYSTYTASQKAVTTYPRAESGFGFEDGALFVNYENNRVSFLMDVSMRRLQDRDYFYGSATIPNQSNNNNFGIGVEKSQLYLRYKLNDNVVFDFGQFDTIYGVELNDSKDRVFGKAGLLYDSMMPLTHTGFMVEYANDGAYGKVFAANSNNRGSLGSGSTAQDHNTEYGAAIGYSKDIFRGQIGYMTRPVINAEGSSMDQRTLSDVIVGATWKQFSIDVEYAQVNDPNKNTLTGATTDAEKAGTGLFVLATYKPCENALMGLRYEHLVDDPSAASLKTADSYGATLHYRLSSDLELRSEYIGYNFENTGNIKWNNSRFNIASLFTF